MSLIQPLVDLLTFNDYIVKIATDDLTNDLARRRLRGDDGTSIAWTLGHGLLHRAEMAHVMGHELPLDGVDLTPFGRPGATDGQNYPMLPALLTAWTKSSAFLLPAMSAMTDAALLEERSGLPLPHGEKRLLDALVFYVWHEVYHLGHVGVLRSHFGLTPIVNLVLSAPAAAAEPRQSGALQPM